MTHPHDPIKAAFPDWVRASPVVCIGCGHENPTAAHILGCAEAQRKLREPIQFTPLCGWTVGPIPKLDGHTCVCTKAHGHDLPHECDCGSWFEDCGRPPREEAP